MKQAKLMNKIARGGITLFSLAMIFTTLPTLRVNVHAENEEPNINKFATKEQLKSFDTIKASSAPAAKVYFGKNGSNSQQWWIVGSQDDDGLTLFAASPLVEDVYFNIDIARDEYEGKVVAANHYAVSDIRNGADFLNTIISDNESYQTTIKSLETNQDYFSTFEQSLMNSTEFITDDRSGPNGNSGSYSEYKLRDILYLPYGNLGNQSITVGRNTTDNDPSVRPIVTQNLDNGLIVDKDYWGTKAFWLRNPSNHPANWDIFVSVADTDGLVTESEVFNSYNLVPAFELNLASVLFASAAPAASSENFALQSTDLDGAFTLRFDANDSLGSAEITVDKSKIALSDVPSDTYLVVQTNTDVKRLKITDQEMVLASDMSLDSFLNCKVWLEKSENGLVYATLATDHPKRYVNITVGEGLTIVSDNVVQEIAYGASISDIVFKTKDGYLLPDYYYLHQIGSLEEYGLEIKNADSTGFTISGTPTKDLDIIISDAIRWNHYPFIDEYLSIYHLNSDEKVILHSEGGYHSFRNFYVDGKLVSYLNYDIKEGSTILHIKNSYLDTLSLGKHTVRMEFDNGYSEGDLTVENTNKITTIETKSSNNNTPQKIVKEVPKTGIATNVSAYTFVLIGSLIILMSSFIINKLKLYK